MDTQYVYIAKTPTERGKCKIGKTYDLDQRLIELAEIAKREEDDPYEYIFICEVSDADQILDAIKEEYPHLIEEEDRTNNFYNSAVFEWYIESIKKVPAFVKEIFKKNMGRQINK